MRRSFLLVTLGLSIGCGATMVKSAGGGNSPYAPANEKSLGGVIKYLSDGASFVVNRRRDDAYKQMYKSCNGPYHIVAEGQRVEGSVVVSSATATGTATASTSGGVTQASGKSTAEGTSTSSDFHYWYIQYACGAQG